MNTNDLYLEYARVIEMCKGTALENEPLKCARFNYNGLWKTPNNHVQFAQWVSNFAPSEFAVAVLEDRPVFVGNRIYAKSPNYNMLNGAIVTKTARGNTVAQFDDGNQIQIHGFYHGLETYFTWTPSTHPPQTPKRTFTLNGVELPCPDSGLDDCFSIGIEIDGYGENFAYASHDDAEKVFKYLKNLLTEARDK